LEKLKNHSKKLSRAKTSAAGAVRRSAPTKQAGESTESGEKKQSFFGKIKQGFQNLADKWKNRKTLSQRFDEWAENTRRKMYPGLYETEEALNQMNQ